MMSQGLRSCLCALLFVFGPPAANAAAVEDHPYPADGPFFSGDFAPPAPVGSASASMHAISYNVFWGNLLPGLKDDFSRLPLFQIADVILLQEVPGAADGSWNAAEDLARQFHLNYIYSPGCVVFGKNYGNAILSRWPLRAPTKVLLPNSEFNVQRTALGATVRFNGRDIRVFSLHLSVRFPDTVGLERSRVEQVRAVLDAAAPKAGDQILMGGDFNKLNPFGWRGILGEFRKNHFLNSHLDRGRTFKTYPFALDHIFSLGATGQIASGTLYDAQGSDHYPIWTELTW